MLKHNFDQISHDDLSVLRSASKRGDYVDIKDIIFKYQLLGACGSCGYSADLAYKLMLTYSDQGWM